MQGCCRLPFPNDIIIYMIINFILYVRDQARGRDFYAAALGMAPSLDVPGMTQFNLGPGCVLGLMPEKGIKRLLSGMPDPEAGGGAPRAEVYLVVDAPGDFHARALGAGAKELSPLGPRDWGDRAAYSLDPDGHVLAFAAPL